jgi:hypothetical protein
METKLNAFVKRAKELGAKVEKGENESSNKDFYMWSSSPNGGCGLSECHCSPGLWISATERNERVTVHFGSNYKRGGTGDYTQTDYENFLKLVEEYGVSFK